MSKATFEINGGVVERKFVGAKFAKVTLSVQDDKNRKTYVEVVSFRPGEIGQLGEGEVVNIKGSVNRRKMDGVQAPWKDGSMHDVWETQLIANYIAPDTGAAKHRTAPADTIMDRKPGAALQGDDDIPF